MELDNFKKAWKAEGDPVRVTIDAERLTKVVQASHRGFQSTVFWRDCREVGTALIMLPLWFYWGNTKSLPWTWWLTVPALVWVAGFIVVDRKRHPQRPSEPGEPLSFYAKEALSQVEHQIWLLRNVFWWYLLPFCISIMAFFLQVSWNSSSVLWEFLLSAGFSGLFVFVLYGATYWLNQYAVRTQLEPRRRDLQRIVASFEDDTAGNTDTTEDMVSAFEDTVYGCRFGSEAWAENWNKMVPSWRVAMTIIIPTLAGALCGAYSGLRLRIPEMGPTFFQSVVGAVLPFEVVFFSLMYLAHRKRQKQKQSSSETSGVEASATSIQSINSVVQKSTKLPAAPALLILILTLLIGLLAVLAVFDFFIHFNPDLSGSSNAVLVAAEDQGHWNATRAKLSEICKKHDVPSMTIAVVNTDGLLESECFGIRKRGTNDRVQMSDRHPVSSCAQLMTATLAAALVEAGTIEWNTSIGDVWSSDSNIVIHEDLWAVTLENLLSHQSGMAANVSDVSPSEWRRFFDEEGTPQQERHRMLTLVLDEKPPQPKGKFASSNLGYAVVGAMLETRAGEPFESLMKRLVFDRLEMDAADFHSIEYARNTRSPLWGHDLMGSPVNPQSKGAENPTVYAAFGTVHLTIGDFAKYARWHLAGKPSPVLKSQETFDHLHTQVGDRTSDSKYGFGWICKDTEFGRALIHGGSNTNSYALIWVYPESKLATVVCTNSGEPQAFPACDEMTSFLLMQHRANQKQQLKQ